MAKERTEFHESSAKLCRAIEAHPCLYDRNNSQYLKREVTDAAWEVIAEQFHDSVESCKIRWRYIRMAYIRSLHGTVKGKRTSNRTRDYHLHDVLKFYWPYLPNGNSEKADCADDSNDDEPNTSVHSKGGSGNNAVPKRIKDRRKCTYQAVNKISEQSKADLNSDDEDDDNDNVSRRGKKQKQAEEIDKNHVRFKRACKRGIDKTIIRELSVRKRKANGKRMRMRKNARTWSVGEIDAESTPTPMKLKTKLDHIRQLNHDQHSSHESEPPLTQHKNIASDRSDEDFLNMLRPRLQEMNRGKKLKFQAKVFECLSILDDSTDSSTVDHEMQIPNNMPMKSTIVNELRVIHELVSKLTPVEQKPIMADAATTTANEAIPETVVATTAPTTDNVNLAEVELKQSKSTYCLRSTPDKTVNNNDKKKCANRIESQNSINSSLNTTMASDVGIFNIPRAPDAETNALVSETSQFERTNSGSTMITTTTNSESASLSNAQPHMMRRYSICGDGSLTRESHQQIIATSANVPSTNWNSCTPGQPRRITRNPTIHQFSEPGPLSLNSDSLLVPRTAAANTTLTTIITTKPTTSVSRNASSIQCMWPKLLPQTQIPQQQSTSRTTPSVVSAGIGSTTVTASTSLQPKILSSLDITMAPTVSFLSLLKKFNKDVTVTKSVNSLNDETGTAAIFNADEISLFPINTEPLDKHLL